MSVVTYAKSAKMKLVGVKESTLETYGAISAECASEMAEGIRALSGADIGISVTGLAGPEGDEGKPVGLVFVGISTKDKTSAQKYFFPYENDRAHIRLLASSACLATALFSIKD
jgi:nicotinamide-nucleotide amidase